MKVGLALATTALLLSSGIASAEFTEHGDRFKAEEPSETVYATERHMGFSLRVAIIGWLGGVPIVKDGEVRASQREKWWGDTVPLLSPDAVPRTGR